MSVWYLPFGGWRTEPTTPLTSRGFTGHPQNNLGSGDTDLGLIYMNARYYLPNIGRFLSADTLVPDPANPQSFNRYAYVRNNPINRTDPTGHLDDCSILGDANDIQGCNDPKPTIPTGPIVSFTGSGWTNNSQGAISTGALITGTALAEVIMEQHPSWGYISPQDAFLLTYHGTVTFNRTGGSCADDSRNTIDVWGARTEGRNLITVYTDADIVTNKSHWARHELGHAFVYAVGDSIPIDLLDQAIIANSDLDRGAERDEYYGFASDQNPPRLWQQSTDDAGTAHSEIWADMYLGWTSNTWETQDGSLTAAGEARSTFMNNTMSLLVDIAVGH